MLAVFVSNDSSSDDSSWNGLHVSYNIVCYGLHIFKERCLDDNGGLVMPAAEWCVDDTKHSFICR